MIMCLWRGGGLIYPPFANFEAMNFGAEQIKAAQNTG